MEGAPLHLKINTWHNDIEKAGETVGFKLGNTKIMLMLRQLILKCLDPDDSKSVAGVLLLSNTADHKFIDIVMDDKVPPDANVISVLEC